MSHPLSHPLSRALSHPLSHPLSPALSHPLSPALSRPLGRPLSPRRPPRSARPRGGAARAAAGDFPGPSPLSASWKPGRVTVGGEPDVCHRHPGCWELQPRPGGPGRVRERGTEGPRPVAGQPALSPPGTRG